MRKLIRNLGALAILAAAAPSHADVGLGVFVGEPLGLDVKIDLQRRSALDLVLGGSTYRDGRGPYGHLTYLVTPVRGNGSSVLVPLRLGIGVAVFDQGGKFGDDLNIAARIEGTANPGGIAVSEACYLRTHGLHAFSEPETIVLKGVGETLVYKINPGSDEAKLAAAA